MKIDNSKDFIVMGVSSYHAKLLRWIETLRENYDGKIIVYLTTLDGKFPIDPDAMAKKYNIEVRCRTVNSSFWRYMQEDNKYNVPSPFCPQWQFIKEVAQENPGHAILRTDVFDVAFQNDPRKYVELTTDSNRVYISYEGTSNKDNQYMSSWLNYSTRWNEIKDIIGNTQTINSGTICTTGKNLIEISDFILNEDRTPDQCKLAVMVQCLYPNRFELVYIEGFMEAMYKKYFGIKDNKIYSIGPKLCCIAHANGNEVKGIMEEVYKIEKYLESEKSLLIKEQVNNKVVKEYIPQEEMDISKTIVISPFAKKMRNGKENPKNYPHWKKVTELLRKNGYKTLQIGIDGEPLIGADFVKFNLTFSQLEEIAKNCLTWISIDSFFPHLTNLYKKRGVAIWGRSDPKIYGYEQNINLLKNRSYLRTRQFGLWEELEHDPSIFDQPEKVFGSVMKIVHEQ